MHRNVATTVASRRTVRRSVTHASPRKVFERSYVAPKSRYTCRRSEYYDDDDDDDDNEYLRPNNVSILHQNRGYSDGNHKKIKSTFKSSYHGSNQLRKNWQGKAHLVREQLNGEFSYRNRQLFKNRSFPKNNHGYGNYRNSSWVLKESFSGWYVIYVQHVDECDEVIKTIQHYISPVQLYPYNVHFLDNTNTLVFAVDDFKTAKILQNINGRIKLHYQKVGIRVKHYCYYVPNVSVSSEVREKMAQEIAYRHNPHTKCLDLSHFHSSQLFTENKLFLPLNQPLFLIVALKIGAAYVKHDLHSLSLKKNHIYLSEGLVWIRRLFPELKALDLGDNKLTDMKALKSLSGFTIKELDLSLNPLNKTDDEEYYKQELQNIFPVLNKLNNSELQSRYSVTVDLKLKMPINIDYSYPVPKGHDLKNPNPVVTYVELFLTQFFERYDNKSSRKHIGAAYMENSVFTLSSKKLIYFHNGNLSKYIPESRNLLVLTRNNFKNSFLHRGRENILNFFEKLPKTKHDLGSFQIDVPLANSKMVQIVVNGVFAENFEESDPMYTFRSFCRTFCLVPDENSWRILSDMLFITVVSNEIKMESVKRFNALKKSLNKNNINSNETNKMIMFVEDADKMCHLNSSSSRYSPGILNHPLPSYKEAMFSNSICSQKPFDQSSSNLPNQQLTTQQHVTSSAVTSQWKQQEPNVMSSPILNLTQPPPLKTCSSPIILSSPSSLTSETQSEAMPLQCKQQKPNAISSPDCNASNPIISNLDKLRMIKRFSNQSGMNVRWTEKCLKENGWDYKKASISYLRLKSRIPLAAYKR